MKLLWSWCEFSRHKTIIWIRFRGFYHQYVIIHDIFFNHHKYTAETVPHIINI